jgi:hypothetical protein
MTKIAGSGSISQRHGSADLDPLQNVMDPQHLKTILVGPDIRHFSQKSLLAYKACAVCALTVIPNFE